MEEFLAELSRSETRSEFFANIFRGKIIESAPLQRRAGNPRWALDPNLVPLWADCPASSARAGFSLLLQCLPAAEALELVSAGIVIPEDEEGEEVVALELDSAPPLYTAHALLSTGLTWLARQSIEFHLSSQRRCGKVSAMFAHCTRDF